MVRLAVFEEVSAIVPNPLLDANEVGPTTTVRSASTTITSRDGQTVVIGGLISDAINNRESKVPVPRRHPGDRQPLQEHRRATRARSTCSSS